MRPYSVFGASLAAVLLCGVACAGDLKSGPQPGAMPTPFSPLNVLNAESAKLTGKKNCLV